MHDLLNPEDLGFIPTSRELDTKSQQIFKDRYDHNRQRCLKEFCHVVRKLQANAEAALEERQVRSRLAVQEFVSQTAD